MNFHEIGDWTKEINVQVVWEGIHICFIVKQITSKNEKQKYIEEMRNVHAFVLIYLTVSSLKFTSISGRANGTLSRVLTGTCNGFGFCSAENKPETHQGLTRFQRCFAFPDFGFLIHFLGLGLTSWDIFKGGELRYACHVGPFDKILFIFDCIICYIFLIY